VREMKEEKERRYIGKDTYIHIRDITKQAARQTNYVANDGRILLAL